MAEESEAIIHRWFEEVWNKRRAEAIDELMPSDCLIHGLANEAGTDPCGPAAFKPVYESFRSAFPDLRVTVEETIADGERVAARCTVRGTHGGEGLDMAPTGIPIEISGMCIFHIHNGQITEAWNNFDMMALYQQIGKFQLVE